eukprot:1381397-Amorphochlora_amoeboformis.AAC.1
MSIVRLLSEFKLSSIICWVGNTFDVEVGEVDENGEPLVDENGHRHAAFLDVLAHPKFMRYGLVERGVGQRSTRGSESEAATR